MYTVTVHDHIMVAHSLRGEVFGPSQRLHGATYAVSLALHGPATDADGVLVDIAAAAAVLRGVLDGLDRRNLDDLDAFAGRNSTTEAVARHIADLVAHMIAVGELGEAARSLTGLTVTLHESPAASASYERALPSRALPSRALPSRALPSRAPSSPTESSRPEPSSTPRGPA